MTPSSKFIYPVLHVLPYRPRTPSAMGSPCSSLPPLWLLLCVVTAAQRALMARAQQPMPPSFAFSWLDYRSAFVAGETAVIKIMPFDLPPGDETRRSLSFTATVNGRRGNSTYITDVAAHHSGEPATWNITFVPLRAGDFVVLVGEERFGVPESTLQFTVAAGDVHPSASLASWTYSGACVAGSKAFVSVVLRDAFGNDVARGTEMPGGNGHLKVSVSHSNGAIVEFKDFQYNGWAEDGRISLEFVPIVAGAFLVRVNGDDKTLRGSPLLLTVNPGPLDIAKSTCSWKYGTNVLQIFSKLEIFIHQKDYFGNAVPEIHPFDARIVKRATNLSVPVADLLIEVVDDGTRLLSFKAVDPGEFVLTIFDPKLNQKISNMDYVYNVFVGYCDGSNSFANGSGLAHSVAGSVSYFMVYLQNHYSYPSPIESAWLKVQILNKNGVSANSTISPGELNGNMRANSFNVSYTPEFAGEYEIWVQCGNIVINSGNPYKMIVSTGVVSTALSTVVTFVRKVKTSVHNEVVVQLVDPFMNPVIHLASKLRIQLTSADITTPTNAPSFIAGEFVDNKDGSYTTYYVAKNTGLYSICIQFEDAQLNPCPFVVHVVQDEDFSKVQNDIISVRENESVSFDVLSNDYIAGGQAVVNFYPPLHGSVLQYNQKSFRYTPFEGFFGNDTFWYIIFDKHDNIAYGTVFISVLCRPPQFISLPQQLHATEDTIAPQFGGFPGIKIAYSDAAENISVMLQAQSGNVSLAPMPMKFHQTSYDVLSISTGDRYGKDLIFNGTVEAINGALQFLKNEDFYGNDIIKIYAISRSGREDAQVPIFVEPINDPPVILAPESIFLGGKKSIEGYQIFDKQRDPFEFSIVEPDLQSFPWNKSHLHLVLSLEVYEGALVVTLPAGIVATAEVKIEGNNCWQPLQTSSADRIVLRAAGIRFRGSVPDCNNAMQRLFYQGRSNETNLDIIVNDLGYFGCYPDCSMKTGTPLSTIKTIRLLIRKSVKSRHLLFRSALTIELSLGCVLLYYILKCIYALKGKGKNHNKKTRKLKKTASHQNTSTSSSDDDGYLSAPAAVLSSGGNRSSLRQRSPRSHRHELELQPLPMSRNNGDQDDQLAEHKDK
uniref:GEX2 N-terminal Ig-like domain-containing protein n=1 Tax=Oryza punctata TaxID=4537 RepID=A0A0E0M1E3_ORYPU